MSMEVPVDSPPKIPQRWGFCNVQASGVQGLLDSMGSFLQLSFTFSRFALADHPREQDRGTLMPVIKSVMKLLCY